MAEQKEIYPFKECEQYVNLLQENITRMASNSANCKNWLVAIIAGVFAVVFSKDNADYLSQALFLLNSVTGLLFFYDCYYLGLEREFKDIEKEFIEKCKNGSEGEVRTLLFAFTGKMNWWPKTRKQLKGTFKALDSWSTTLFYVVIFIILLVIRLLNMPCCCCH